MSDKLPHDPPDQMHSADNFDAPPDILALAITEETAERVLDAMCGVEDREPVPRVDADNIPAFVQGLRRIYESAYNAHFLSSRELVTELDKLLRGIKGCKRPEDLEEWTTPEKFDHFAELFQAAALEIWLNTDSEEDYRDFRVTIADSRIQAFKVIPKLVSHLRTRKNEFDSLEAKLQPLWCLSDGGKLKKDIRLEYYKYFRKRSDQMPDKTIVQTIAAVYTAQFGKQFTVSETNGDFRRSDIHRFNDGFPIRFACAVIQQLRLHLLMAPIGGRKRFSEPTEVHDVAPDVRIALGKEAELYALSPSAAPKHRPYDQFGNSLTVDVDAPFPWSLTKTQKDSFRDLQNNTWALPSDDWELVKNRIGDSWTNK